MKFHILTLFPEMVQDCLNTSITGRAVKKNIIEINAINIRDFTLDKHGKVDDYTYGGGAGMLMQAQPVFDAHRAVTQGRKVRTVYVTPQGIPFTQRMAEELAKEEEIVFLCGHYEGIDERVLEEVATDCISIGDYVLTGGELPAMVMIDAVARLVPGVLNNDASAKTESFHNDLLEYPQYSRPEVWHGKEVPAALLTGDHKKIAGWRLEQSIERTRLRRPDLYRKYQKKQQLIKYLSKDKRNNIHMIESLARGKGEILYAKSDNVLIYDENSTCAMISAEDLGKAEEMLKLLPGETELIVTCQAFVNNLLCENGVFEVLSENVQFYYPQKQTLPVKHKDIRPLERKHLEYVLKYYGTGGVEYLEERICCGAMFGAFVEDKLAGFIGVHSDGSSGMLFVEEAYRGRGLAVSLEAYCVNRLLEKGFTPYGHVAIGNEASLKLQERMGLYAAKRHIWWLGKAAVL